MDASDLESWWTRDGWKMDRLPLQMRDAEAMGEVDWMAALHAVGYEAMEQYGSFDNDSPVVIEIYTAPDRHLFIELWNINQVIARFFVAGADRTAFLVDKLPLLLNGWGIVNEISEIYKIRKTLVAFVRYGRGADTIDEDGEITLDDRRRLQERKRQRAEAKRLHDAQQKQTPP